MLYDRSYMQPGRRSGSGFHGSMVRVLIWSNVFVFILTGFGRGRSGMELLLLHPDPIRQFEVWRLGTYLFAHANLPHLLFNMWGLFIFGKPLEQRLGSGRFMNLYMTSGIIGGLVWLAANWSGGLPVVGASGAVFGVMMATAMLYPNQRIMLLFPPVTLKLKTFVAIFGGLEVWLALNEGGGRVAHIAHLGGIAGGFLYMRQLMGPAAGRGGARRGVLSKWRQFMAARRRSRFDIVDSGSPDNGDRADDVSLSAEVDRILDKIAATGGEQSLTAKERKTLKDAAERLRRGH